ncbi:Rrf2 family transcriptional regulator [Parvularcula dongshanensis]|uniref:Rrf2 family iron-sulfur cluster assembly transcriptional regulator n=1 Tax=Parvularcula dongshanensis TaxID=1173995 RepID=A0A840I031_9PROT|nr:Rrf2 family transcriptional regulator [Parvularcula dongshanensis]MBB4657641.1 Rrf2 family iron-sulfur cluster assembly transcriptional regulator [Parvularcula dongshanensis]
MKLTAKARLAVTAMADIAAFGGGAPVPLSEVARRQVLSLSFLEQVFGSLRRAGLVESRRGAAGGYVLAREPSDVTLADVVAAVDEEVRTTACAPNGTVGCTGTSERCLTHGLWRDLDGHIEGFLSSRTLADVAAGVPEARSIAHG